MVNEHNKTMQKFAHKDSHDESLSNIEGGIGMQKPSKYHMQRQSSDMNVTTQSKASIGQMAGISSDRLEMFRSSQMELKLSQVRQVGGVAKLINHDDVKGSQTVDESLILVVKTQHDHFSVTVTSVVDLKPIFRYVFQFTNPIEDDLNINFNDSPTTYRQLKDLNSHFLDSIGHLNSSHLQEQVQQIYAEAAERHS